MSAPRPYVTNPFHPLSSIRKNKYFPYLYQSVPIFSSKWYAYVCQLRMCCSKILSPRSRTIIQVILISILYVLARIVFFQAHFLKKKKEEQIGHNLGLVPTYKIFVTFSFCTSENKLKTKDKKATTTLESHYTRKRRGKNTSHYKNGTIFKRW